MQTEPKCIAIIQGHPDPLGGHFCHALAEAYARGAGESGHDVRHIDVARLEFPFLRSRADQHDATPEVIAQAQRIIAVSDHIVMLFPIWNGGTPAVLRGFLEQVFRPAFVFPDFRPGEHLGFFSYFTQKKALTGKSARIIATMQMPGFFYRWYFRPHTEKNILSVGGLGPIRESLVGLVESRDGRRRERWLRKMYQLGREGR